MTYIVCLVPKRCAVHVKFQNHPFRLCTISARNPWFNQSLQKSALAHYFNFIQKLKRFRNATRKKQNELSAILIPHDTYIAGDHRRTFAVRLPTIHRCATNCCIIQLIKQCQMSITLIRSHRR